MTRTATTLIALTLSVVTLSTQAMAADLVVEIGAIRNTDGQVRVALYNSAEKFLKPGGPVDAVVLPSVTGSMSVRFSGLIAGQYAIALYHDENGNGELDSNLIGIPLEGTAFSRDGKGSFGPPKFADVAVRVRADEVFVTPANLAY
jgi:uncharacterized protein (DUF2141 family)